MTTTRPLSPRQLDILALAAEGFSNIEIGEHLFISEDTVKTHMWRICKVLGARNRAHAVHLAHLSGALPYGGEIPEGGTLPPAEPAAAPRRTAVSQTAFHGRWTGGMVKRPAA